MLVGIDLGTTNSLVSIWRDGQPVLIPNALGQVLTPSVVGLDESNSLLVGQAARDQLVSRPAHTAATFKRYMGTDRAIAIGPKTWRAEELSAMVLRSLKADAEAFLGEQVTEAVITVPAYFNDAQRKATKAAGQLAGLKVDRLLTEPTAAALAYGFAEPDDESIILVIDIGGGTLDVSLLHSFEGIMEVKASAGDTWLGGEDFTDAIVAAFMADVGTKAGIPAPTLAQPIHGSLRRKAEILKRELSDRQEATIEINYEGRDLNWVLDRERFDRICEPLLARVRLPLERALKDARIQPELITRIIFAGGASRMPMFRRLISRLFRQLPLHHINPDEVVCRGAAVRTGLLSKGAGLEEHVLTDVAPFTLGVGVGNRTPDGTVIEGLFLPVIERNTIVPASRSHVLNTIADNQTAIKLDIYQGEARLVKDNIFLGGLRAHVPAGPAGREKIVVRFTYDTSGLLDVEVTSLSTKAREQIVIEGNPGVLTREQIKERLAALEKIKTHPRESAENIAVLSRAQRLYEENLGDLRAQIGRAIDTFMMILERQEPAEIDQVREQLVGFLNSIDHSILP